MMSANVMKTGENFQGYFNNSTFISGGMNLRLIPFLSLSSGIFYSQIYPKADVIFEQITPISKKYSIGLNYSNRNKMRHKLSFAYRSNTDRSDQKKFDFFETKAQYAFEFKTKTEKFNLKWRNAFLRIYNRNVPPQESKRISIESNLSTYLHFSNAFKLNSQIEYSKNNRYTPTTVAYLFYGLTASYAKSSKIFLSLSYRNNYPLEDFYKANSFFNLSLKYQIIKNHLLVLSSRISNPMGELDARDFFVSARYTHAINLPVHKNKNLGNVHGVLRATEAAVIHNRKIELNGFTTLTDEFGAFTFNDIPPGEHYLSLDPSTLHSEYISKVAMPLKVEVQAQHTQQLELELIPSAQIVGKLNEIQPKNRRGSRDTQQLPSFILKLYNKQNTFYTRTDKKGQFVFSQILPGAWTLEIITKGFEKKYKFDTSSMPLELESGEVKLVDFNVRPIVPKIQFSKKKFKLNVTPKKD